MHMNPGKVAFSAANFEVLNGLCDENLVIIKTFLSKIQIKTKGDIAVVVGGGVV